MDIFTYPTVIHEQGLYRFWYNAKLPAKQQCIFDGNRGVEVGNVVLCYAESRDGVNWIKPSQRTAAFNGSKDNNIVSAYGNHSAVFRDDSAQPDERYKGFHYARIDDEESRKTDDFMRKAGLYGMLSPDGLNWRLLQDPLIRYHCDTQNVGYRDPLMEKYVGYFRSHWPPHRGNRAISRSETDDFTTWPLPETILRSGVDDPPCDDLYTNGFTVYPGLPALRLIFSAVFHHNTDKLDVRMAVSHDGRYFQWVTEDPVLECGEPGEWDCAGVYTGPNLVYLPDGRLALPYGGTSVLHDESYYQLFYRDYRKNYGLGDNQYAWAIWDDGRLAGIEAENTGEFTTYAHRFEGSHIEINARTGRAGNIRIALWEEGLSPVDIKDVAGCSFEEALPFSGDEIWTRCRWTGTDDLANLKGKEIGLCVRMDNAKIFGYRFV